jgi:hypothetical protein
MHSSGRSRRMRQSATGASLGTYTLQRIVQSSLQFTNVPIIITGNNDIDHDIDYFLLLLLLLL